MNYKELLKDIKDNNIGELYLVYGEEYLLSSMMVKNLKKALVDESFEQFNYHKIDDKNTTADDIISQCETMPFMSEKRMVLIVDYPLLANTGGNEKDGDKLIEYLNSPNKSTCLVFISKTIDKKRRLYKNIAKNGSLVECAKLERKDLERWITKRIRISGKTIDKKAMDLFIEGMDYLGKDSKMTLGDIENETEKLISLGGNDRIITQEEVEKIMVKSMESNIFKMLDHIGTGNLKDGLEILDYLFDSGEPAIKILSMIVRQFRIMYQCKILKMKGYSTENIASLTGLRTFMVNNALRQSRRFDFDKLKKAYNRCARIDILLKSSRADPKVLLELLLYDFR
ncbi:DNA polymerase III subunit delta [Alkalibacter saccharofermentans]|uniref:DNA polymerase III subunit delta n=1 Tax=Alkalibacter saccharofermentans DSM 14828 TaxID=1120975 RepID=A0A1M4XBZ3_9FIRM|nr:DNA polymerase III subunit delta [Alkalibacter saccharofermentans]SHE90816.1 DNA polymerase III, delta subunit [Alkalibacter saccharofermentans DSM 14828]